MSLFILRLLLDVRVGALPSPMRLQLFVLFNVVYLSFSFIDLYKYNKPEYIDFQDGSRQYLNQKAYMEFRKNNRVVRGADCPQFYSSKLFFLRELTRDNRYKIGKDCESRLKMDYVDVANITYLSHDDSCLRVVHTIQMLGPICSLPSHCGNVMHTELDISWLGFETTLCYGDNPIVINTVEVELYNGHFEPSTDGDCDVDGILTAYYIARTKNNTLSFVSKHCYERHSEYPDVARSDKISAKYSVSGEFITAHLDEPMFSPVVCFPRIYVDDFLGLWDLFPVRMSYTDNTTWNIPNSIICKSATVGAPKECTVGFGNLDNFNEIIEFADNGTVRFAVHHDHHAAKTVPNVPIHDIMVRCAIMGECFADNTCVQVVRPSVFTYTYTFHFTQAAFSILEMLELAILNIIAKIGSSIVDVLYALLEPLGEFFEHLFVDRILPFIMSQVLKLLDIVVGFLDKIHIMNVLICGVAIYLYTQKFIVTVIYCIMLYIIVLGFGLY